jgi:hypothetical protein
MMKEREMNTNGIWNELAETGRASIETVSAFDRNREFIIPYDLRQQLQNEARKEGVRLEFRVRKTGGACVYLRRQAYYTGQYIT